MPVFGAHGSPRSGRARFRGAVAVAIVTVVLPASAAAGPNWDPIPTEDWAVTRSAQDPEAGAEILLWTIRVEDEFRGDTFRRAVHHEIRTKIFDARGAEACGHVELAHPKDVELSDIAARTVQPDGSAVELSGDQVLDRMEVKSSSLKVNAKTFAFPAVAPGCVLEHRWTEVYYGNDAGYLALEFQRRVPVRRIDLLVKALPLGGTGFNFKVRTFNLETPNFVDGPNGFRFAVLPPMPAERDEPHMPPRREVTPWAALYYTYGDDPTPEGLWKAYADRVLRAQRYTMHPDGETKAMAMAIVTGSPSHVESADRLHDWCRTNIDDLWDDRLPLSDRERRKESAPRQPGETLKRRRGTALDIVHLFIAMCRSVGIDARLAVAADRSEVYFTPDRLVPGMLREYAAAIPSVDGWRFYDPGARWLGAGRLPWFMQGGPALVLDWGKPTFEAIPLLPADSSVVVRSARLRLSSDGRVAGTIRSKYRGHLDALRHEGYDALPPAERMEEFRKTSPWSERGGTLDSIRLDGVDDPMRQVVEEAMVTVPGYAQPAGDRLLVPLSFFEWKGEPVFSSDTRRHPVDFGFPWAECDTVRIEIPDGYEVEALPTPEPDIVKGVARYRSQVIVSSDGGTVVFVRAFSFGIGGRIYFPPEQYPSLKSLLDGILRRDEAAISLKRKA